MPKWKDRELKGETTELLPVKLTDPELIDRGSHLAKVEDDLGALDRREADAKAEFKAQRSKLEGVRHALAGVVRDRQEMRPVILEMFADYEQGVVEYIRTDLGEIVRDRPMGEAERQQGLFDKPKKRTAPEPDLTGQAEI